VSLLASSAGALPLLPPALLAAAGGLNPLVQDIGVALVASAVLAVIVEKARGPIIAAFLLAGVLVGPNGLSAVTDQHSIETIASLGLALLLFLIGLEVNVKSLLESGRTLLVVGLLQVPLSIGVALVAFTALASAGLPGIASRYDAGYLAIACAFSSTLIVVKLLQERLQLDTVVGRISVGLLIVQDVWAIVILALQPNLAKPDVATIGGTFLGIAVVGAAAFGLARFVLPTIFRAVAKSPELVVTTALGWCFGIGLLGASLGPLLARTGLPNASVSLEMGALLAGASIASFPYAYDVVGKVANLRDFFITLFFVALGMGIPKPEGWDVIALAAAVCGVTVLVRGVVFVPLFYAGGLDRRNAVEASFKLGPVSEFCLVIAYLAQGLGHIDARTGTVIVFAFVATAVATPLMFAAAETLEPRFGRLLSLIGMKAPPPPVLSDATGHVARRLVFLGFHRIASAVVHDLERAHPELVPQTLVVDTNVGIHERIRKAGIDVVYGDIASREALVHAGVPHADVVVSTVPDDILKGTTNLALVRTVRQLNPRADVIAHALRAADVDALYEAGATYVFMQRTETSRGILPAVYAAMNGTLPQHLEQRRMEYGMLRERREVMD
jgi:Kef-type K+ transport system membrane component KefB